MSYKQKILEIWKLADGLFQMNLSKELSGK